MIAHAMQRDGLTGQGVLPEIRAFSRTKGRRTRNANRKLVLIEITDIGDVDTRRQVMPAIGALDQRCAPQGPRWVFPAEREIHFLAVMDRPRLDQRFAGASEIRTLLR